MRSLRFPALLLALSASLFGGALAPLPIAPDITVALDGTGDFKSIHAAAQSIPRTNGERKVIFVKNGVYAEKVRVDAACVTIRGESREGTRIEASVARGAGPADDRGQGVLNLTATAHDFVLENVTVKNTHGQLGIHAFAIFGRADRTVIQDCDVLSHGNDTLSLWRGRAEDAGVVAAAMPAGPTDILKEGGRYYHTRLKVTGSVDFICPRGWCYISDSIITELNPGSTAAMWHDGSNDSDKKFVMKGCTFEGPPGWYLARRHHDGHFYFIDCSFSAAMRDQPPYRVTYPLNGGTPTAEDIARNKHYDQTNKFGDRSYFHNSHRVGGDYAWHRDNLATAPGAPKPGQITAVWTFAGTWDPERTTGPKITRVELSEGRVEVTFDERVTVKGRPKLILDTDEAADYVTGSGTTKLIFGAPAGDAVPVRFARNLSTIVSTIASATLRVADLTFPPAPAKP